MEGKKIGNKERGAEEEEVEELEKREMKIDGGEIRVEEL